MYSACEVTSIIIDTLIVVHISRSSTEVYGSPGLSISSDIPQHPAAFSIFKELKALEHLKV